MSYGSNPSGGYNEVSKSFKANPTIQNYLKLRRAHPEQEIEVAVLGGFDSVLAMQSEFERHGFDVGEIMSVLDADQDTISAISLKLLEELVRQEDLIKNGETHLIRREQAMPLQLIDWIIGLALEAMSWTDTMEMNRDLIVLIKARLLSNDPSYHQKVRAYEARQRAIWIGAQLVARGEEASVRKVADYLGVSPSTVSRWFQPGEFLQEAEERSVLFNEDGSIKDLFEKGVVRKIEDPT
ncbi:MAG: helix-turn-helix domain-containing protein [Hyphomonas sp.]|nr:helix-turn-helix domain-containing protein [Hyphomonas sp.]